MTIALVASSPAQNSATSSPVAVTAGVSASVGDLVVVYCGAGFGSNPGAYVAGDLAFSGTATVIDKLMHASVNSADDFSNNSAIFTGRVSVAGTVTATITKSSAPQKQHIHIALFSGSFDGSREEDANTVADTASDTAPASGNMTSAGAALFVGGVHIGDTANPNEVVGADYTELSNSGIGGAGLDSYCNHAYRIVTGGTTDAVDWTAAANSGHTIAAVVIKEAAAGATLVVADASHGHTVDAPALVQANALAVQDATHGHTVDAPALVQAYTLAPADASHGHTVDAPALVQANALAVQEATHSHTGEAVTLSVGLSLAVQEATHSHAADAPALVQAYTLAPADASHGHTGEAVTLSVGLSLAVQEATHSHAADAPALVQANALAVQEATHGHTGEAVTLTEGLTLAPADSTHGHTGEAVVLEVAGVLAVQEATHGHTADAPALVQANALAVDDGVSAHLAETIALALDALGLQTDNFNRADIGANWPAIRIEFYSATGWNDSLIIDDGQTATVANDNIFDGSWYVGGTFDADMYVQAELQTFEPGVSPGYILLALGVRGNGGGPGELDDILYWGQIESSESANEIYYSMWRQNAAFHEVLNPDPLTFTQIGDFVITPYEDFNGQTMRVEMQGNRLRVLIGGIERIRGFDSVYPDFGANHAAVTILKTTPGVCRIDNFEAANILSPTLNAGDRVFVKDPDKRVFVTKQQSRKHTVQPTARKFTR